MERIVTRWNGLLFLPAAPLNVDPGMEALRLFLC